MLHDISEQSARSLMTDLGQKPRSAVLRAKGRLRLCRKRGRHVGMKRRARSRQAYGLLEAGKAAAGGIRRADGRSGFRCQVPAVRWENVALLVPWGCLRPGQASRGRRRGGWGRKQKKRKYGDSKSQVP